MSSSEWAYVVERVVTPVGASSGRASSISRVVAKEAANGRVFASVACWRTKKGRRAGETTPAVFVSSLEVEERFRRRGVARALVEEVETMGREDFSAEWVTLSVNKTNVVALQTYERLGFTIDEDEDGGLVRVLMDPLRLVQHRMSKPIAQDVETD
jgi:ribosomal protein S18 acetylase RimI-like enzyme|tara:strand:+ start:13747 stop:14214 length:468 start_codon:yes stop_codon:yes gene_type:complete